MSKDKSITLCKIADEVLNIEENTEDPSQFSYWGKVWKLRDKYAEYSEDFFSAVTLTQERPSKKIRFVPISSQEASGTVWQLTVCYMKNILNTNETDHVLARTIFPHIFENYKFDLEQNIGFRAQDHLEKVYVSTELYDAIYEKHKADTDIASIAVDLPERFQPELRGYQERTVKWLLKRERQTQHDIFPKRYYKLITVDRETTVYKHFDCLTFLEGNEELPLAATLPPGGILADEMGLGKTVEVIALLLLNPRIEIHNPHLTEVFEATDNEPLAKRLRDTDELFCICASKKKKSLIQCMICKLWQHKKCVNSVDEDLQQESTYMCPQCWTDLCQTRLVESGTTFIVSPNTIRTQWVREIKKHTNPDLRVLCYEGMNAGQYINPLQLSKYDVVLTDYNILRSEIYHTDLYKSDRQTRGKPRSIRPTSPLLCVQWWRVCLDEAQMVESNTSKAAELVRMLPAINRWAVTGTPIQNSLYDLEALLRFVGFNDFLEPKGAWDAMINAYLLKYKPTPLIEVLQKCMWRTCKSKVKDELALPEQNEEVHRLFLSNVEMLHYREEHTSCTALFLKNLEKYVSDSGGETPLAKISPTLLRLVLQPLLKIRQCCTMSVVQKFICKLQSGNVTQKQFMNPKELLEHLKSTNELSCKTCLRTWASSYNGIAAIHVIRAEYEEAIKQYKHVLRLAKDYNTTITVDTLLQIHALHNILEVNANAEPSILSDDKLQSYQTQLIALDWKYLSTSMEVMANVRLAYQANLDEYQRLQESVSEDLSKFFSKLVGNCGHVEQALLNKIEDDCRAQGLGAEKIEKLSTMWGVLLVIDIWHQKIVKTWKTLRAGFVKLNFLTEMACKQESFEKNKNEIHNFVISVSDCHLSEIRESDTNRTNERQKNKKLCGLCKLRQVINEFECLFFAKELQGDAVDTEGTESPSFEVALIKSIFLYLKSKPDFQEFQDSFTRHWESIELLQIICKRQIKFWIEIEFVVKAFDELDMCKMRLSVTNDINERSNFRFMPYELDEVLAEQKENLKRSQLEFTRLVGRLKYLKHLEGDLSEITCPICQSDDDERYAVLECGHIICYTCLNQVMHYKPKAKPECPICRAVSERVYYALKKPINSNLVGIHSSKVAYIVNLVLKLRNADPSNDTKIIIFSQWEPILKAISSALSENGVLHRAKCTPRAIDEFKDPTLNITCMLMPFIRGSKGLNLIEATHVFLVEPILNPGEELQAIGRVHRFGQTKPTTVHRFIVNDTIEENIFNFIGSVENEESSTHKHWELESMTWQNLKDLFVLNEPSGPL